MIDLTAARRRAYLEACALRRAIWFHAGNDDGKKFLMVVLVLTWCAMSLGIAFGEAKATIAYGFLSIVVGTIVGRVWGIESSQLRALGLLNETEEQRRRRTEDRRRRKEDQRRRREDRRRREGDIAEDRE